MKTASILSLSLLLLLYVISEQYDLSQRASRTISVPNSTSEVVDVKTIDKVEMTKSAEGKKPDRKLIPSIVVADSQESDKDEIVSMKDFVSTGKPEQIKAYYANLRKSRATLMQNQLTQETSDPAWAEEMSQRFSVALTMVPGLSSLKLGATDCRQTLCAMSVDISGNKQQHLKYMKYTGTVLGVDAWIHHDAKPGTAMIYVSRDGAQLPRLEQANIN